MKEFGYEAAELVATGSNLLPTSVNGLVAEEWEVASVTPVLKDSPGK